MSGERERALREAAAYAIFYAEERMRLCGDAILHDPILRGEPLTQAAYRKSLDLQSDGTINSAAYHAATDIARHLTGLADKAAGGAS